MDVKELRCFVLYCGYGLLGFMLELGVLAFLLTLDIYYLFSVLLAWTVGTTTHYLLSHSSAFEHAKKKTSTSPIFFIVSSLSVIAGLAFVFFLVEYMILPVLAARVVSAVLIGIIVFLIHRLYTFR